MLEYSLEFDSTGKVTYSEAPMIPVNQQIDQHIPLFADLDILNSLADNQISPYLCQIKDQTYYFDLSWSPRQSDKQTNGYTVRMIDKTADFERLQEERTLKNRFKIENEVLRKDIEEEQGIKAKLQQKNEELQAIFNNTHEGIIYLNARDKKLLSINERGMEILGAESQAELSSRTLIEFCLEERFKTMSSRQLMKQVDRRISQEGELNTIVQIQKLDGSVAWITVRAILDQSNRSRPTNIMFIGDITQEYEAKKHLEMKNEELQRYIESNIQLEQFAHVASHDLRAPIITIKSFSKLLSDEAASKLNELEKESLFFIQSNAEQMYELVNDLLEYSQVNSQAIKVVELDLQETVQNVISLLQAQAVEREVTVQITGTLPTVLADKVKMKRVFQNVIGNSIKFSDPAKDSVIRISCKETKEHYRFEVFDNGIGIKQTKVDIFLPYIQLNNKAHYKGTGLGLAICKRIISQHQGQISYDSIEGQETKFAFTISKNLQPLKEKAHTNAEAQAAK